MKRLTAAEAVAQLETIDPSDPEAAHAQAEQILKLTVPDSVLRAYVHVGTQCRWWACA